jgi:hypothetical protein
MTLHERVVDLVHRAEPELAFEHRVGPLRLGHDHEAAGADVEAVDDSLPFSRTARRHPEARTREAADDGRARPPGARVRRNAHRLVHHDDVVVVVDDAHALDALRHDDDGTGRIR